MHFYDVWVRSARYHGTSGLTYHSDQSLPRGTIVSVPLGKAEVLAIVMDYAPKPAQIKTKAISEVLPLRLPKEILQLLMWLGNYYPSPIGVLVQMVLPPLSATTLSADSLEDKLVLDEQPPVLPELTSDQLSALKTITEPDSYLLHGRTGSGKTRIYIELARRTLKANRSALLLTPEISLTAQLLKQFNIEFPGQCVLLHSTLTPKQRRMAWLKIANTKQPLVVIGPRSAIFCPLANIGLIVLDEFHEPAYKQEQAPYYYTPRVAGYIRQLHQAVLVLASATPAVGEYYLAEQKNKPILRLTKLATPSHYQLNSHLIDLHDRSLFSRSQYLSQPLIEAVEQALSKGEQSLLYLNRRGTARVIICEVCDWQALCPRCELPLTYHGDSHSLRCHICNFSGSAALTCPSCGNPSIKYLSIGTKAVVEEISRLFPQARIQRFDADNKKGDRFEAHYEAVRAGEVDILIGTQLLAKGIDLPKLSVLGVLLADSSLQMPDYTANERTYQLLSQVLGRVGRGHIAGQAFIQTYQPSNPILSAAISGNWQAFYDQEINDRKNYNFPPFCFLLKLTVARKSAKSAETAAKKLAETIKGVSISGPAPAFHEKSADYYHWQLVLKSRDRSALVAIIRNLPSGWSYDIDPADLL